MKKLKAFIRFLFHFTSYLLVKQTFSFVARMLHNACCMLLVTGKQLMEWVNVEMFINYK